MKYLVKNPKLPRGKENTSAICTAFLFMGVCFTCPRLQFGVKNHGPLSCFFPVSLFRFNFRFLINQRKDSGTRDQVKISGCSKCCPVSTELNLKRVTASVNWRGNKGQTAMESNGDDALFNGCNSCTIRFIHGLPITEYAQNKSSCLSNFNALNVSRGCDRIQI